jgi:uncharacterized damage-inducible protein DinB
MLIEDFRTEFARYRALGEKAMSQVPDDALNVVVAPDGNSIAMIVRHMSGNLISRFTEFLTTDGEKPSRDRDREFEERKYSRQEMDSLWKNGWQVLERQLGELQDSDADRQVTIRQQPLSVHAALARSATHLSYHVGQIVLLARMHARSEWQSLSIPKGKSPVYNQQPTLEKGIHKS